MVRRHVAPELRLPCRSRRLVVAVEARLLGQYVAEDVREPAPVLGFPLGFPLGFRPGSPLRFRPRIRLRCHGLHVLAASVSQSAWKTGCAGFQPVISCSLVDEIRCDRISGSSRPPAILTTSRGR